jgi:DNA mismatch endonuclease (patch repair protein)
MPERSSNEQRSYNMSRIRSKHTGPELKLKNILKILGFEYQPANIYGKPDFADKKHKIAVFIDGCFWHMCPEHFNKPKNNREFWIKKITANVSRDKIVNKRLQSEGWRVMRVWEHSIKKVKD